VEEDPTTAAAACHLVGFEHLLHGPAGQRDASRGCHGGLAKDNDNFFLYLLK
jgi:hypothetical protein